MITVSIDCTLLDKARFKEVTRQNGKKAIFCDLVLIETPNGKFGDYMVKQSQSKEDREARKETPILGNGKIFKSNKPTTQNKPEQQSNDAPPF
jgi:hypothetical protein